MKPFDLQKALAGEPVVTRDGRKVTQLTKFNIDSYFPVVGVVDNDIQFFGETGEFLINGEDPNDLFMASKTVKKEGWVNLYKTLDGEDVWASNKVFNSKDKAVKYMHGAELIATIKIEWGEEI